MTPRSPVSADKMLTVLAYFREQGGPVAVADAARELSLTEKQLRDTLSQLWCCGLPGHGPGQLVDLAFWSEVRDKDRGGWVDDTSDPAHEVDAFDDYTDLAEADYVEVTFFAGIDRPLRLTFEEAITLKTALATLVGRPEVVDQEGLDEALRMLGTISPTNARLDAASTTAPTPSTSEKTAEHLRSALESGLAVRFVYHSAGSDSTRIRIVDGGRLHVQAEHAYLRGVDREIGEWRTFRTDRIAHVEPLGPSHPVGPEPELASSTPTQSIRAVVPAGSAWFVEQYPFRDIRWREDGSAEVTVDYYNPDWLRRFLLGNATTLQPLDEGLRADIAEQARAALSAYGK